MTDIIADSLYSTISNLLCIQLASSPIQYFTVLICRSEERRHKEPDSLRESTPRDLAHSGDLNAQGSKYKIFVHEESNIY